MCFHLQSSIVENMKKFSAFAPQLGDTPLHSVLTHGIGKQATYIHASCVAVV